MLSRNAKATLVIPAAPTKPIVADDAPAATNASPASTITPTASVAHLESCKMPARRRPASVCDLSLSLEADRSTMISRAVTVTVASIVSGIVIPGRLFVLSLTPYRVDAQRPRQKHNPA